VVPLSLPATLPAKIPAGTTLKGLSDGWEFLPTLKNAENHLNLRRMFGPNSPGSLTEPYQSKKVAKRTVEIAKKKATIKMNAHLSVLEMLKIF
jgi:hypothetical protein